MTTPFVYKWTHLPTLQWYVGVHYRKGCHPDIDDGYLGSSKYVVPLIKANPEEWKREIIDTGSKADMCFLEREILELFDARHDPRSLNRNNAGSPKGFRGDPWNKGMKTGPNPKHSELMKGRSAPNKGLKGAQIAWNKGLPKEQQPMFGKISGMKGKKQSVLQIQTITKMAKENNPNKIKVICPQCGKEGSKPAMKRFHFDKCGIPTTVSDESKKKRSDSAKLRWASTSKGE